MSTKASIPQKPSLVRKAVRWLGIMAALFGVGLVVLAGLFLWCFNPLALGLPKDSELVAIFRANHTAFERIRAMAMEDAAVESYLSEDTLKQSQRNGHRSLLTETRRNEYIRLMAFDTKMTVGVTPLGVRFVFTGGGDGLAIGRTWMKGIIYLPEGAEKGYTVRMSLDDLGMWVSDGEYVVPIEPNWYLIYSQSD